MHEKKHQLINNQNIDFFLDFVKCIFYKKKCIFAFANSEAL